MLRSGLVLTRVLSHLSGIDLGFDLRSVVVRVTPTDYVTTLA